MPRPGTPLTDQAVRKAKGRDECYQLYDTHGLYLTVAPSGAKWWRLKYYFAGKEKRMGIGPYPDVSLAHARLSRDSARALVREGRDPQAERKASRSNANASAANTFKSVAGDYLKTYSSVWAVSTLNKNRWLLDQVMSDLGARPIAGITPQDIVATLDKVRATGRMDTARRVKQCIGQVFALAVETQRATSNPAAQLRRSIAGPKAKSRAALTSPADIKRLLVAIEAFRGHPATHAALRLAPLLFVRPGELRTAEWSEFDLNAKQWRIPASKMKMKEEHLVPLSAQALAVLNGLKPFTSNSKFVFPSVRSRSRPMSENTINAALRGLGFTTEEMTAHGFRAMASTRLNELGFPPKIIELQLSHAARSKVAAAYDRASHVEDRTKMMQTWADYLHGLVGGEFP